MATSTTSTTTFDEKKYNDLRKKLSASPTAYTPGVAPTKSDIKNQMDLMSLENKKTTVESEAAKVDWYGTGTATKEEEVSGKSEGMFAKALNVLSTPLYGIVGGVEAVLGKGTEKGLANVQANINERGTFGDLLRKYGAPSAVSMPMGLALDIAMDPVNWLTAGTAAIVPRIVKGALKAGPTGLRVAAESSALSKAVGAMKFLPESYRPAKFAATATKLAEKNELYNALIGRDFNALMAKKALTPSLTTKGWDWLEKKLPGVKAGFAYSPVENVVALRAEEEAKMAAGLLSAESVAPKIFSSKALTAKAEAGLSDDILGLFPEEKVAAKVSPVLAEANSEALRVADEGVKGANDAVSSSEVLTGLRNEATQVARRDQAVSDMLKNYDETGWKGYDDMMKKISKISIAGKYKMGSLLDKYAIGIGLFKNVKTSGNPASYVLATIGNTTMAKMAGLKLDTEYWRMIKNARNIVSGKKSIDKDVMNFINKDFRPYLEKRPGTVAQFFGVNWSKINAQDYLRLAMKVKEEEINAVGGPEAWSKLSDAVKKGFEKDSLNLLSEFQEEMSRVGASALQLGGYQSAIDVGGRRIVSAGLPMQTSGIIQDIYSTPYKEYLIRLRDSKNSGKRLLFNYLSKTSDLYEQVDQSFKMGLALKLSHMGITEKEVEMLSRIIPGGIQPGDWNKVNGLYKISLDKSMEAAAEVYMNYMAMPNAAKVLRQLPLFGAPFASFTYAMTGKTAKTLLNNPAIFNKVNFMLQELSGSQSPLEKVALKSPYYKRYADPGMVKVPLFFKNNPVYLNMTNMLPYYTLNIFQPSERRFNETLPDVITSFIDKSPVLKTPEGQIMFDYFILPLLLKESDPKGLFNQPLYPQSANAVQKYGLYPARQLAEAWIPPVAGALGVATPEAATPYLPSYQWRKVTEAVEGKTPLGVVGKEPAFQRTARAIAGLAGFPLYPVNLSYISAQEKAANK